MNNKKCLPLIPGTPVVNPSEVTDMSTQILNRQVPGNDQNAHILHTPAEVHEKVLIDDVISSWVEYIPDDLPDAPVPLVIARHGGDDGGKWQSYTTSWDIIARREGFMVLYPDANWYKRFPDVAVPWRGYSPMVPKDHFAIREILAMIDDIDTRHSVDRSRIYMQGHSVGDMLTAQFALATGETLAGIVESSGPLGQYVDENGELAYKTVPVPACISFSSNNGLLSPIPAEPVDPLDHREMQNLEFWKLTNGATGIPRIGIDGLNQFAYYEGKYAPVLYHEVLGRCHSQPFDEGEMAWSTFFSGLKRTADGGLEMSKPFEDRADYEAVAIAEGSSKMYFGCDVIDLDDKGSEVFYFTPTFEMTEPGLMPPVPEGKTRENTEGFELVMYAPVSVLEKFGCKVNSDGRTAIVITPDGRELQLAEGNIGYLADGKLRTMLRNAESRNGVLYIPIAWFVQAVLGLFASERYGVLYISRRYGKMTENIAAIIKKLLTQC